MSLSKKIAIGAAIGVGCLAGLAFIGLVLICHELDEADYHSFHEYDHYFE